MAKKIEELIVELGIAGLEKVDKLKSSFRDLNKVTKLTDKEITGIRQKLIEFGSEAGNTQQVSNALTKAFEGLIGEARKGSAVWAQLNRDLQGFRGQAQLTDSQIAQLAKGVIEEANAHSQSEVSIRRHIKSLQDLRAQAVLGGQVNRQLGNAIEQLSTRLDDATASSRKHFSALSQALAIRPDAILRQWQAYTQVLNDVRATAEQAAEAQRRLNALAGAPRISARRAVAARTEIQMDPEYQRRFGLGGQALEGLPDVPAALSLRLRELQEDLNYTTRSSNIYIATLVEMANVQRQASAATQGFAAALREQLASGQLAPTQKNLQEVIGALRREMLELDQTTAEGSRKYAENASQANALERQLKELANSYRTVADAATTAATAEQNAANARMRGNYFNRRMMREQEQAFADFANSVNQAVASTPLMLPAAGQTSAPGTGLQVSGGARIGRATGRIQTVLTPGTFPGERTQGPAISPEDADRNRRAYISQIEAERNLREEREASERQLMGYRAEVSKAAQANDGSINSLNRYRESLVTLRNVIPSTEGEFKKLRAQIERVDAQLERAQGRRRRLNAAQATQAAGAVISGGIFGGPEGALGGAIGTAIGGVPGAFAGAAFGAQIGMIRQSLGEMASFTAEIDKQRIALRNVVGSQEAYNSSLRFIDATSRRLAIPQDQLNKQFTQLSASVIGAGGNVDAAKIAFEGIAAGIRGTGGSLADMDGALRATAQVFSKGKVSAEELRQQIGERLPGAFTLFAQATGRTPQELDKALEKGEVSLNDFMVFVRALSTRYGASAEEIAASSQAAGDRIQVTFARLREAVGRELQPVGAGFQDTFARLFEEAEPGLVSVARGISAVLTALGTAANAFIEFTTPIRDFLTTYPAVFNAFWTSIGEDVQNLLNRITSLLDGISSFWSGIWDGIRDGTRDALRAIGVDTDWLGEQFSALISWLQNAWDSAFAFIQSRWKETVRNMVNNSTPITFLLKRVGIDVGEAVTSGMEAGTAVGTFGETGGYGRYGAPSGQVDFKYDPFSFETGKPDKPSKGGKGAKGPEDITATELFFRRQLIIAREGENKLIEAAVQLELDLLDAAKMKETPLKRLLALDEARARYRKAEKEIGEEMGRSAAKDIIDRINKTKEFQRVIEDLRVKTGEISGEQLKQLEIDREIEAILTRFPDLTQAQIDKVKELVTASKEEPSSFRRLQEGIKTVKDELAKLTDPVNQIIGAANAIGDAFGNSFKGLITGATTAKEALANFFSSVADYFADMAAKMIAEWIKLAILNTIVRIFNPSGGGFSVPSSGPLSGWDGSFSWMDTPMAKGGAFAANGIVPYAKGGIVNRPTMFKFARGGTMQTGIMGEAGPEAIMPLKRGPDGKLGVQAAGGGGVAVTVNVDAKGTQVQGDPGQGQQLGRVIAGAVQAELIKQQRPGGLLANPR